MKKLLLALLLVVLALPSAAFAFRPPGTLTVVPDAAANDGSQPAPKSWLFPEIFVVRAHTCRGGGFPCGPDPLISTGAAFNGILRFWVPFNDNYTVYLFVSDTELALQDLKVGTFFITAGSYFNVVGTFAPFASDLYKFHVLIIANGSGLAGFSDYYQFRQGGPGSGGCCP